MPRYYFHDDRTMLDDEGVDLPDLAAARAMAIVNSGEILRDGVGPAVWSGRPWHLWVTDAPNGGGRTFFTLTFSAAEGERLRP